MSQPGFWDDPETAGKVVAELKAAKATIDPVRKLLAAAEDAGVMLELAAEESDDPDAVRQLDTELTDVSEQLERVELLTLLSRPNDARDCFFSIQAGAGGTESCDWAEMLLRMYLRYFEPAGYKVEELSRKEGEGAGIASVNLLVRGPHAYGYLSCEAGVHRLIRLSPFDSAHRRHTSFAGVDVLPELDEVSVEIDWAKDVREDTYRASGAGGQHVNKTSSAIRLTHLPTGLVVQCQNERSQHQNRANARKMLAARLQQLEEKKRDAELAQLYDDRGEIAFGGQIRTYWLHPTQRVKDHRTGVEIGNAQAVLDGELDDLIAAQLRHRAGKRSQGD